MPWVKCIFGSFVHLWHNDAPAILGAFHHLVVEQGKDLPSARLGPTKDNPDAGPAKFGRVSMSQGTVDGRTNVGEPARDAPAW